jgi:hypothetical protein
MSSIFAAFSRWISVCILLAIGSSAALSQAALTPDITPCLYITPHVAAFNKFLGRTTIASYGCPSLPRACIRVPPFGIRGTVCTKGIPKNVVLTRMTCEVYGNSHSYPCSQHSCPHAWTEEIWMGYDPQGLRHYCWRVRNTAGEKRDFSVSVAK